MTCATVADEPQTSVETPELFQPVMPTIPESISRPSDWPTSIPSTLSKNVLSSILEKPGAPLEPVDEDGNPLVRDTKRKENDRGSSDVVLADYEETRVTTEPTGSVEAEIPGMKSLDMAQVVARVGPEVVLAGDLMTPAASEWIKKVSPGLRPEQIAELRFKIYQQVIDQHLETLLVYVDACRVIPE